MTVVAVCLLVALVALQFLHMRERDQMRTESLAERAKLLDRIQFPDVRQVEAGEVRDLVPPRDMAELAFVGGIVPDGIDVGGGD